MGDFSVRRAGAARSVLLKLARSLKYDIFYPKLTIPTCTGAAPHAPVNHYFGVFHPKLLEVNDSIWNGSTKMRVSAQIWAPRRPPASAAPSAAATLMLKAEKSASFCEQKEAKKL
jgi:hypothetical protein